MNIQQGSRTPCKTIDLPHSEFATPLEVLLHFFFQREFIRNILIFIIINRSYQCKYKDLTFIFKKMSNNDILELLLPWVVADHRPS